METMAILISNYPSMKNVNIHPMKAWMEMQTANTTFNGKSYSKSGAFNVEDLLLEDMDNQANHQVLRQIANQTNGKFYSLENSKTMYGDLTERKDLVNMSYAESVFIDLIDWKILFLLILIALVTEWSLRRYFGGY